MIRKLFIIASIIFALGVLLVACVPETSPGECDRHEYIAESYELEAWSTEAPFQKIDTVKGDFYLMIFPTKYRLVSQAEKPSGFGSFFTSCYADQCFKYLLKIPTDKGLAFDKSIVFRLPSGKDTLLEAQTNLNEFRLYLYQTYGNQAESVLYSGTAYSLPPWKSYHFPPGKYGELITPKQIRERISKGDTISNRINMNRIKMEQGQFNLKFKEEYPGFSTSASITLTYLPE